MPLTAQRKHIAQPHNIPVWGHSRSQIVLWYLHFSWKILRLRMTLWSTSN